MSIKSSQNLVEEANKIIETLNADEVKSLVEKEITLVDVRISESFGEMEQLKIQYIYPGNVRVLVGSQQHYQENKIKDLKNGIFLRSRFDQLITKH